MPGRGTAPKPKAQRRTRHRPVRGDWKASPGIGWQFGALPVPPDGLKDVSLWAWQTWFAAWFAAHWTPDDLPGLRTLIRLYDQIERGDVKAADRSELRQLMDNYGVTPKGQQDRRWVRPEPDEEATPSSPVRRRAPRRAAPRRGRYAKLKVIGDD